MDIQLRSFRQNKLAVISAAVILLLILLAVFAPLIAPYGESDTSLTERLAGPSQAHILGTDQLGRDVLTRLLYGARVSLVIGIVPSIIAMAAGAVLGLLAGYLGGAADHLIMRTADVMLSIPSLLMAMVIMFIMGSGTSALLIALSLNGWAPVARVIRSQTLSLRELEYIDAARTLGSKRRRILFGHIMPNCMPSLIVLFTLRIPSAILTESALSFLGIGVQPPAASWGLMVNESRQFLFVDPWLCLIPCLTIMVAVLAFNFLGDGLRDVLDPYRRAQSVC